MDPISDMLTRIRNAHLRGQKATVIPHSRLKKEILDTFSKYGYLKGVKVLKTADGKKILKASLKYIDGSPAITGIKKISKSGQRIYSGINDIKKRGGSRGMIVMSTSKGILPHWEAKKQKTGGEVICVVY